jgi:hypothetical protein
VRAEFGAHRAKETIATMVAKLLVNLVRARIDGNKKEEAYESYSNVSCHRSRRMMVQLELLRCRDLPVVRAEGERSMRDRSLRLNDLIHSITTTHRRRKRLP